MKTWLELQKFLKERGYKNLEKRKLTGAEAWTEWLQDHDFDEQYDGYDPYDIEYDRP